MSKNVKILLGVLLVVVVLGGTALAVGGDDLLGRMRLRRAPTPTPRVIESVNNPCPQYAELAYSNLPGEAGQYSSVPDLYDALWTEMGGVGKGAKTDCHYSIEVYSAHPDDQGVVSHSTDCVGPAFHISENDGLYSIACGTGGSALRAVFNLYDNSSGFVNAEVKYFSNLVSGLYKTSTNYLNNPYFKVMRLPNN